MNKECLEFLMEAGYKNMNRSKFPPYVLPGGSHAPVPAYNGELELWAHPNGGQCRPALEIDPRLDLTIGDIVGFMLKTAYEQGAKDEAGRRSQTLKRALSPEPFVIQVL